MSIISQFYKDVLEVGELAKLGIVMFMSAKLTNLTDEHVISHHYYKSNSAQVITALKCQVVFSSISKIFNNKMTCPHTGL